MQPPEIPQQPEQPTQPAPSQQTEQPIELMPPAKKKSRGLIPITIIAVVVTGSVLPAIHPRHCHGATHSSAVKGERRVQEIERTLANEDSATHDLSDNQR